MEQRIINLELGRIHDRNHQILLKLTGTDVSDEKLNETFHHNIERCGVDPRELFTEWYEHYIRLDTWEKLQAAGFVPTGDMDTLEYALHHPVFVVNQTFHDSIAEESFPKLLLWYLTYGTDTSYEVVKAKNVFEGFVPIVKKSSGMGFGLLNH